MTTAPAARPAAEPLLDPRALARALGEEASPVAACRHLLRDAHAELARRFGAGVPAHLLVRARADLMDAVLARAWRHLGLGGAPDAALIAVGGYGRRELQPGSDVDVMVLLGDELDAERAERVQRFVTLLWDIGIEPGHSVRTLAQCAADAERDITVATNLMEARLVDGPEGLFRAMREATGAQEIWPSRRFFEAKWAEQRERHHKYHDTAYNLEPNVKEGPGGLRDIQMIGWVAKRHFGADSLHQLVSHGFLTESEHKTLVEGQSFLWQVRFALHLLTGRREDRLLFDHQRAIAEQLGYRDRDHNLAVEQFMKRYYRTVMELEQLNEMLLELFQEEILHGDAPAEVTPVNARFRSCNGFLEVADERVFKHRPSALLELFLVLERHPGLAGVRASTIRLVRDHRYLIDECLRSDAATCRLFVEIISQPAGVSRALKRMHRYGVLGAYLPAFGAVVGQMQYDLFHAYTVDQHTLFVVENLEAFGEPGRCHEFPLLAAIFQQLPKPELLYLAGLFHDIAKGRGGDHSELGAEDALQFCLRHGFSEKEARTVAWLVRHHLLMSVTAQRRDIHDPSVVERFAAQVGDTTRLDYLYLLTVADIRGTNPKLWNDWKSTLLKDLYESTVRALHRGLDNPIGTAELVAETRREAERLLGGEVDPAAVAALWATLDDDYFLSARPDEIAWHTRAILGTPAAELPLVLVRQGRGGTEVFTYTEDQEYLFAAATALLDRLGLNIVNARIITASDGMTLDSYVVLTESGEPLSDPRREAEIRARLGAALQSPRDIVRPAKRLPRRQLRHFRTPTRVEFLPDHANQRTIMEVTTSDRPGLLARIGSVLASLGVRLQSAKIATLGERAEDTFFVTDRRNRPLNRGACERLRRELTRRLEERAAQA